MSKKSINLSKKIVSTVIAIAGLYFTMKALARKKTEDKEIDEDNPYIDGAGQSLSGITVYERTIKPMVDKGLSFAGLVILSPLFAIIAIAIFIDDPGPIFFTQKRVGKDKKFFCLHKFRSMKMSTPHDIPTHQLSDPEQYITGVGKVLRKTSLDELPQIWDIFRGRMSIIGPRPALWNQEDLVSEREKYGVNGVLPGLTGWAQINGRDELEILEKAKLDGEYVRHLKQGGIKALFFDVKCFFGTIRSVAKGNGVVEGGTGEIHRNSEKATDFADAGFDDYGYKKKFHIDRTVYKRILITGANSYVGESFESYARKYYSDNFLIDTVDTIDGSWREMDFGSYDVVFHVAGIAHADVGSVDENTKKKYYAVNTDLAIEAASLAKASGVGQFVFMSSMIVYGESTLFGKEKIIDEHTVPEPANFYGDSKWQADKGVRKLNSESFHVAVLRPPMIYGPGSKGNYPTLAKIAKKLPLFPAVDNQRSMLYIENLCEFLCLLILSGEGGIYFPQNMEYTNTSEMVKGIAGAAEHSIKITRLFNPVIKIASHIPGKVGGLVNKAFGNSTYSQKLSQYNGLEYQGTDLFESIRRTEGGNGAKEIDKIAKREKKHILVISQYFYPETFRINDMAEEWVNRGYKVTVLTGIPNYPMGKFFDGYDYLHHRHEQWNGIEIIRIPLIPRGSSFIGMIANYCSFVVSGFWWKSVTDIHADLAFTFEVSPMTQALIGCWYAKKHHIPHYLYVTDLWPENVESITGIHNKVVIAPIQKLVDYIYKNCERILTSSQSFIDPIIKRGISPEKIEFWPQYAEEFYKPVEKKGELLPQDGILNLVFAGNIGYAQGLGILVEAAKKLKEENKLVRFNIIGDGRYLPELQEKVNKAGVLHYFNFISRQSAEKIPNYLAFADALLIILSKSEVFSITIPAKTQSCMACGKPILLSADGEVQDIIREANAGLCSSAEDIDGFVNNIKIMIEMSMEQREKFAFNALAYSNEHFNKKSLMGRLDEIFQGVKTNVNF